LFPHFPATTYSSKMLDIRDTVSPMRIVGHCARFKFSDERAVLVSLSRVPYFFFICSSY
jgi:hypothetical protein